MIVKIFIERDQFYKRIYHEMLDWLEENIEPRSMYLEGVRGSKNSWQYLAWNYDERCYKFDVKNEEQAFMLKMRFG